MYYIASLAKFGNCCSMVWAHRQLWSFLLKDAGGKFTRFCILSLRTTTFSGIHRQLWSFLLKDVGEKFTRFCNVFLDVIFYPCVLQVSM